MSALRVLPLALRSAAVRVNGFLLWDVPSGAAMVIDPGGQPELILDLLAERGLRLAYIALTHGHFDHILGTAELAKKTGARVCMHRGDLDFITDSRLNVSELCGAGPVTPFAVDLFLTEGLRLPLGGESAEVLETPGHTPGSVSLYAARRVFCGDAVLRGTTGRMDLPLADPVLAAVSVREKLLTLPEDTVVCCGHGQPSTVSYERANNTAASAEA